VSDSAKSVLFWDFEGTLARRPFLWAGVVREVLSEHELAWGVERPVIALHLKSGFPWQEADRPHPELSTPEAWWNRVGGVLEHAMTAVGVDTETAHALVPEVRAAFLNPATWLVFEDTRPVLSQTAEMGWSNVVLSNHAPELPELVEGLGLGDLVDLTLTSATLGYEKPHPEAFNAALKAVGTPAEKWSIGDSLTADVVGAERAGIPAILVRRPGDFGRVAADLDGVMEWIRPAGAADA
jgi:putative hydrolase of the HAD superfamily